MAKDDWKFHENQAQLSPIWDYQAYVDTKMDDQSRLCGKKGEQISR